MHLEQTALIVDDYDEAIRFFVDVLGFELVEDSPSRRTTVDGSAGSLSDRLVPQRIASGSSGR